MTTSRATIRAAVADLLEDALSLPDGNVMRALPGGFRGATPVVLVLSGGSGRAPWEYGTTQPVIMLDIKTYVLMGKNTKDGVEWSSEDTEAKLDELEAVISAAIQANATSGPWMDMHYTGRSRVEDVLTVDGFIYRRETIPIVIECEGE